MMSTGVAAALSREFAADQRDFLPLLAKVLKDSLPNEVELIQSGLFKKTIKGVVVNHGENRLTLVDEGHGPIQATFTRVVRGIALKSERLTIEEWLVLVSESLEESARENAAARAALARTLGLN